MSGNFVFAFFFWDGFFDVESTGGSNVLYFYEDFFVVCHFIRLYHEIKVHVSYYTDIIYKYNMCFVLPLFCLQFWFFVNFLPLQEMWGMLVGIRICIRKQKMVIQLFKTCFIIQ
jgi:hypothetical protein